jgi:hypothetical protein
MFCLSSKEKPKYGQKYPMGHCICVSSIAYILKFFSLFEKSYMFFSHSFKFTYTVIRWCTHTWPIRLDIKSLTHDKLQNKHNSTCCWYGAIQGSEILHLTHFENNSEICLITTIQQLPARNRNISWCQHVVLHFPVYIKSRRKSIYFLKIRHHKGLENRD